MQSVIVMALTLGLVQGAVYRGRPGVAEGPESFCGCVQAASSPGDSCLLQGGHYEVGATRCEVDGAHGSEEHPIIIGSAGDGPVVIDGTIAISGPWTTGSGDTFSAPSPDGQDLLQLFVDGELQVLARYPNARWSDKSVFYAVAHWFRSTDPGVHNRTTGEGLLTDNGKCADMATDCCSRCNSHDLAASGVNATGALAILNLWACDTGVQQIIEHTAAAPSILRYIATWDGLCDNYEGGEGRYYLEGLPSLLDDEEEWLFDTATKRVMLAAEPAPGASVRGRVSDFALVITNASWIQIANLSFFGTTLSAAGDVANLTLSSLDFNYSATSRRSLGEIAPPIGLTVWQTSTPFSSTDPANFLLEDVVVRYSDGPALMINGDNTVLQDCLFEWNDWSTVGGSWPLGVMRRGKAHRATTVWAQGNNLLLRRLTFRNNGAAQSVTAGGRNLVSPRVEMCSFASQLQIQDDGSFVEGGGAPSTVYVRNWCTDTGKAALRWDGYYAANVTGGLMLENVAWNTSALVIKGDQHNVTRNTVFDGADTTASHAAHDRPRSQDHTSPLNNLTVVSARVGAGTKKYDPRADQLTTFEANVFDLVAISGAECPSAPNCTVPGQYHGNLIGSVTPFDVRAELRDPYHHDFRPCPQSTIAEMAAGAYPPWSVTDATYWIPGRRLRSGATTEIPPSGSIGVHLNTELMWLPAVEAIGHSVYLGLEGGPLQKVADVDGVANIARPSALGPDSTFDWRVDTQTTAGAVVTGPVWSFTTGKNLSCQITPHPPPKPDPADTCPEAEKRLCPGLAGKGAKVGEPCYECVVANSKALQIANCYAQRGKDSGTRHAFIIKFCGPGLA